jgi:hypothetical protein
MRGTTDFNAVPGTGPRPPQPGPTGRVKIVTTGDAGGGGGTGPAVTRGRAAGGTFSASRVVTNLLIWGGSILLAVSAVVHFHLWDSEGYRNIPTIGPLFLLQAIVGFVLAIATAIFRKLALVAASAVLAVSSIGGLLISIWWGLFGWQESFSAPYVGVALWVEGAAAVLLGAASVLLGFPWLAKMRSHSTGRD